MSVTYELLEEFTGTRTNTRPDPENEGETISEEVECRDVKVLFTCSDTDLSHERTVNVCLDSEGSYDSDATLNRIDEVALGVANKIACGTIS
jgi:hypothetical protein